MHYKNLPHGKGDVEQAIGYLFSPVNHAGIERSTEPRLLAGDPQRLQEVCDQIQREWKYTSGGLFFEETLTDEQKYDIIESFEAHAFPGLDKEQYEILWVEHNDHNSTELNYIIARTELNSGKALNAFPPGHQDYWDLWRNKINLEYGFSRPDVPKNLFDLTHDKSIENYSDRFKELTKSRKETTANIGNFVLQNFANKGMTNWNYADVVDSLKQLEELGIKIVKQSEKFISVEVPGHDKNIRLKGAIYDQRNYENDKGFKHSVERTDTQEYTGSAEEYRDTCKQCDAAVERRHIYNSKRYRTSERVAETGQNRDHEKAIEQRNQQAQEEQQHAENNQSEINQLLENPRSNDSNLNADKPHPIDLQVDQSFDAAQAMAVEETTQSIKPLETIKHEIKRHITRHSISILTFVGRSFGKLSDTINRYIRTPEHVREQSCIDRRRTAKSSKIFDVSARVITEITAGIESLKATAEQQRSDHQYAERIEHEAGKIGERISKIELNVSEVVTKFEAKIIRAQQLIDAIDSIKRGTLKTDSDQLREEAAAQGTTAAKLLAKDPERYQRIVKFYSDRADRYNITFDNDGKIDIEIKRPDIAES